MAKYSVLQTFYASDVWRNLRVVLILERGMMCQYCNTRVTRSAELTGHHMTELTPDNYMDANISLNPDNIMIVHHSCHNSIHKRGGYNQAGRQAFLEFGAPLSGKHTFVQDRMWPGDLVVDMDLLYSAASMRPCYDKPDSLIQNVNGMYSLLLDNVQTRCGRWDRAWVIGGFPDKWKRESTATSIGAEIIFIDATREQCQDRLLHDEHRKGQAIEWTNYIDKWFGAYKP